MILAATETTSTPKISTRAPVHALACWAGNGDRESVNISSVSEDSGPPQPVQGTSTWLPNAVRSSGAVSPAALATARSAPVTMPGSPPVLMGHVPPEAEGVADVPELRKRALALGLCQ